ncbi:MAG: MBL fold metallo-hydrolase [Ruminococcaceae bacterium]|nr:MBL fold metallo-hydrolase [Oscillospiraceae bacterium]
MTLEKLCPGSWGSNCYLLVSGTHAAVVDPSVKAETLCTLLQQKYGATLDFILLTHGHFDHVVSVDTLRDLTGASLYMHKWDAEMLSDAKKSAFYTFFRVDQTYRAPERLLEDGDELTLGEETIRVIATPGHSMGSVCYLCNDEFLITGDTLFAMGYGRYDLWGGDEKTLFDSLASLRSLPQHLPIYPGHGESALLGAALDNIIY